MNATQRILNALQKFQKKPETFFGFLGRKDGVVKTTRQFYSYVLLYNNQLIEAFNDKVPNTPGLPVEVQVVGGEYKIVGIRDVYNDPLWMGTPEHYFTHEWPGYDSVPIHGEQFIPGLVSSVSLFVIRIYGITYYANGGWTPAASIDIDLASYKPATGAIWLLVELGSNGIVNLIPGANFTLELLANNIPSPTPGARALAAVKLYAEQFQLQQTKYRSDIRDLRFVSSPWIDPSRFGIWYFHSESSGAYLILNQDIPEQVAEVVSDYT